MRTLDIVFALVWAVFWIYWIAAAFSMKKGRVFWSRQIRIRFVIVAIIIALGRLGVFHGHAASTNPTRASIGLVLLVLGLGFAVWARLHIGRNWGTPMTQKLEPELVTSGPYRLVRHPIYSGILLAGIGTAVALDWIGLVIVVLVGTFFIYSAGVEERYMTSRFPSTYPAYRAGTKMLIPFVF